MVKRHPGRRLVKRDQNDTVADIATVPGIHRNLVHRWIKEGLPAVDSKRPKRVLGRELGAFPAAWKAKNRQLCKPVHIDCVVPSVPGTPAGAMTACQAQVGTLGNLMATCPACDGLIHRHVYLTRLTQVQGNSAITLAHGSRHTSERGTCDPGSCGSTAQRALHYPTAGGRHG